MRCLIRNGEKLSIQDGKVKFFRVIEDNIREKNFSDITHLTWTGLQSELTSLISLVMQIISSFFRRQTTRMWTGKVLVW